MVGFRIHFPTIHFHKAGVCIFPPAINIKMKTISIKVPEGLYEKLLKLKGDTSWKKFLDLEFIGYRTKRIDKLKKKLDIRTIQLELSVLLNVVFVLGIVFELF